ncbi:MAG: YraN family protein [Bacteroidaceae bacterium]|nr:YraN family protein [Bacteroidaceae bacterium]
MAAHNQLGHDGEEAACRYLGHQGYRLLERNKVIGHLEIDIVAEWYGEVVFVEVKTRSSEALADAADAVDQQKKENLINAALAYMKSQGDDRPFRFDIISVVGQQPPFEIKHQERAFTVDSHHKNRAYLG